MAVFQELYSPATHMCSEEPRGTRSPTQTIPKGSMSSTKNTTASLTQNIRKAVANQLSLRKEGGNGTQYFPGRSTLPSNRVSQIISKPLMETLEQNFSDGNSMASLKEPTVLAVTLEHQSNALTSSSEPQALGDDTVNMGKRSVRPTQVSRDTTNRPWFEPENAVAENRATSNLLAGISNPPSPASCDAFVSSCAFV